MNSSSPTVTTGLFRCGLSLLCVSNCAYEINLLVFESLGVLNLQTEGFIAISLLDTGAFSMLGYFHGCATG